MIGGIVSACLPGEFEPQAALMLGFNELLPVFPSLMVALVEALIEHIPVLGIVESEEQRRQVITLLCDWGLPAHLLNFVFLPVKGMWVRDYGPSFVRQKDGTVTIIDAEYVEAERPFDDQAPSELAALLKLPVVHVPLTIEGGNLLSNGQGLCLSTRALELRNRHRGLDLKSLGALLKRYYGFEQYVMLQPLVGEPTGHIDMFATFVAEDVVLVGQYDPAVDPVNADILNANAAHLATVRTRRGPLKVVRIPMPSNRGSVWRTYTNVIFANGMLLVPSYPDQNSEVQRRAMAVYAAQLPGWRICPIDASAVIENRGALRCVSINIPWLKDRFTPTVRRRPPVLDTSALLSASPIAAA